MILSGADHSWTDIVDKGFARICSLDRAANSGALRYTGGRDHRHEREAIQMSRSSFMLNDELGAYVTDHSEAVDAIAQELIDETARLPMAEMQISPEQGVFLKLLVQLTGATSVLEIGTFTGFSALCMARGLPGNGRLLSCDVSDEWTSIGRRYWERAGIADRIDLRIGPALDTLAALPSAMTFDRVFIDADKPGYPGYFHAVIDRVNAGGLILADNVLRGGQITGTGSDSAAALREFNHLAASDPRVETVLLPVFDGLTFARKH